MITTSLSRIGTRELFTLSTRVKELIANYATAELGIELYAANFLAKYESYKASIEKQANSADELAEKDAIRDNYFIALRNYLRNFQHHPNVQNREDAKKILAVLSSNGDKVYATSYNVETAALLSMFAEIDKNAQAILSNLGASEWYTLLKDAQTDFETTLNNYTNNKAESQQIASASAMRKDLEDALRKLFVFLPLQLEMTKNAELNDLTIKLQAIVDRF